MSKTIGGLHALPFALVVFPAMVKCVVFGTGRPSLMPVTRARQLKWGKCDQLKAGGTAAFCALAIANTSSGRSIVAWSEPEPEQ